MTGYFARETRPYERTKVHAVAFGKPICGVSISEEAEFQWCAGGVHLPYIECQRCLKTLSRQQIPVSGKLHHSMPQRVQQLPLNHSARRY